MPRVTGDNMYFHEGQADFQNVLIEDSSDTSNNELLVVDEDINGLENYEIYSENEQEDEQLSNGNERKRKQYCRHTQQQIREMECFFRRCPHPDENQRRELSHALGLDCLQVKFWFQNKRTQMKALKERRENNRLHAENEKLRRENRELQNNIALSVCEQCGCPCTASTASIQDQIILQNEQLKKEIERISATMNTSFGNIKKALPSASVNLGSSSFRGKIPSEDIIGSSKSSRHVHIVTELDKSLILELANSALNEVEAMARVGEPVWFQDYEKNILVLNEQEYFQIFQKGFIQKPVGFITEASRECGIVNMNPLNVVEVFMELSKWLAVFSGMISKAMLLEVLSTGPMAGNYDGAQQMIAAKLQVLSPAAPTRDCVFVRYSKQLNEGTWAVVDVSVDAVLPDGFITTCQRRPSGCIIQAVPNGCSMVTWVEHVQVKDIAFHCLSQSIINSGVAYGAKRWISILKRQCERVASGRETSEYPYYQELNEIVLPNHETRQNLLKLAERLVLSFCGGITSSAGAYHWTEMSGNGADDIRIMTRKITDDPGRPRGLVISASICFWVPAPPNFVFEYIMNEGTRAEWDVLSVDGYVQRLAYIGNGLEAGNCVSVLRKMHSNEGNMLILQESSSEPTMSYIIYTPMDMFSANMLFRGKNPENIQILPSGFTILPSGPPIFDGIYDNININGTLLSTSFQVLVDSDPDTKPSIASIATVKNLIDSTTYKMKKKFGAL